jgi:hypothetical protein
VRINGGVILNARTIVSKYRRFSAAQRGEKKEV